MREYDEMDMIDLYYESLEANEMDPEDLIEYLLNNEKEEEIDCFSECYHER